MDDLAWLEDWYRQQCDGDWEELRGVDGIHIFVGEPPTDMEGRPGLVGEPGRAYKLSAKLDGRRHSSEEVRDRG